MAGYRVVVHYRDDPARYVAQDTHRNLWSTYPDYARKFHNHTNAQIAANKWRKFMQDAEPDGHWAVVVDEWRTGP